MKTNDMLIFWRNKLWDLLVVSTSTEVQFSHQDQRLSFQLKSASFQWATYQHRGSRTSTQLLSSSLPTKTKVHLPVHSATTRQIKQITFEFWEWVFSLENGNAVLPESFGIGRRNFTKWSSRYKTCKEGHQYKPGCWLQYRISYNSYGRGIFKLTDSNQW